MSVFPGSFMVRNSPANAGDTGSIPGPERSPGEGNGNQYSCLENSIDRGLWWTTVYKRAGLNLVTKQQGKFVHGRIWAYANFSKEKNYRNTWILESEDFQALA